LFLITWHPTPCITESTDAPETPLTVLGTEVARIEISQQLKTPMEIASKEGKAFESWREIVGVEERERQEGGRLLRVMEWGVDGMEVSVLATERRCHAQRDGSEVSLLAVL
jgi:hypothetical protein